MSEAPESLRIAGHPVEVLSLGRHSIGVIRINENVTVIFQVRNGGDGLNGVHSRVSLALFCLSEVEACDVVPPRFPPSAQWRHDYHRDSAMARRQPRDRAAHGVLV
jgi:hypothetical protein